MSTVQDDIEPLGPPAWRHSLPQHNFLARSGISNQVCKWIQWHTYGFGEPIKAAIFETSPPPQNSQPVAEFPTPGWFPGWCWCKCCSRDELVAGSGSSGWAMCYPWSPLAYLPACRPTGWQLPSSQTLRETQPSRKGRSESKAHPSITATKSRLPQNRWRPFSIPPWQQRGTLTATLDDHLAACWSVSLCLSFPTQGEVTGPY